MKQSRKILTILLFSLFSILLVQGCIVNHKIAENMKVKKIQNSEKIPLSVGLYIDPTFKNQKLYGTPNTDHIFHLGEGMDRGAKKSFEMIFSKVIVLNEYETDLSKWNLDVVASPAVAAENRRYASHNFCTADAKWTIIDKNGNVVYTNTIRSEINKGSFTAYGIAECMSEAVEDHYNRLTSHLLSAPWWQNIKKNTEEKLKK
jgi:hypothetical protein